MTRRGCSPNGRVEVVPDHPPLGAYDRGPTPIISLHPYGFEHPLVMGELEQVVGPFPGCILIIQVPPLTTQRVERRTEGRKVGAPTTGRLQVFMPLHIDGPITAADRGDEDVGSSGTTTGLVGGQSPPEDE